MIEICPKCNFTNKVEKVNPYVCSSCGSLVTPKTLRSRIEKGKKSFINSLVEELVSTHFLISPNICLYVSCVN